MVEINGGENQDRYQQRSGNGRYPFQPHPSEIFLYLFVNASAGTLFSAGRHNVNIHVFLPAVIEHIRDTSVGIILNLLL